MSSLEEFALCTNGETVTLIDRAVSFLYYRSQYSNSPAASVKDLVKDFVLAGLPAPHSTRLNQSLAKDKRTSRAGKDKWQIRSDKMGEIAPLYVSCINAPSKRILNSGSVIPKELTENTKGYIEEVTRQINGCYDHGYFDASGVMIRRLVETLIIETFEFLKIESLIKDKDGNYFMLNELINSTLREHRITLGRSSKKGLSDAKWLGDQSAHNRRFIATQIDIDRIQQNIRILVQELLWVSGLVK